MSLPPPSVVPVRIPPAAATPRPDVARPPAAPLRKMLKVDSPREHLEHLDHLPLSPTPAALLSHPASASLITLRTLPASPAAHAAAGNPQANGPNAQSSRPRSGLPPRVRIAMLVFDDMGRTEGP